jgi:hypothetical protein
MTEATAQVQVVAVSIEIATRIGVQPSDSSNMDRFAVLYMFFDSLARCQASER